MNNNPIGIFDSGVGGLSVLKQVVKKLPHESIVYFGDTARCPYGTKPMETVYEYSKQICNYLIKEHNVKAIVIACNTATIASIDKLKKEFTIPIIGVPDFGALDAHSCTVNHEIGLLATDGTIKSGYYQKKLMNLDDVHHVIGQGCPNLVLDVESNDFDSEKVVQHIKEYTKEMVDAGVDTIILGCTHFPFVKDTIAKNIPEGITIVDPANKTVDYIQMYLMENDLFAKASNVATIDLYSSSDHNETMKALAKSILNEDKEVTKVDIDNY